MPLRQNIATRTTRSNPQCGMAVCSRNDYREVWDCEMLAALAKEKLLYGSEYPNGPVEENYLQKNLKF